MVTAWSHVENACAGVEGCGSRPEKSNRQKYFRRGEIAPFLAFFQQSLPSDHLLRYKAWYGALAASTRGIDQSMTRF